ncbi:MAG: multidrug efflux SMR transporter [Anaerolineales bacterium]|nr:multidrug efflux SMR transporter [Anaerolineales bacterium]MCB9127866.1 multidrug efflux SMR transporter [Ardenticatenales bacterium]
MGYLYLAVAIVSEVIATVALRATEGFTRPLPSLAVLVGYALSFYMLSLVLRTISVSVAYAVWSGVGMVLVTIAAAWLYQQYPSAQLIFGLALIIIGVVIVNLAPGARIH